MPEMFDQFRGCLLGASLGASQSMLCVLESYIANDGFDPLDVAERLLDWYREGPAEIDPLTREACENLLYGYNFERAGYDAWRNATEDSRTGDPCLVRSFPIGLMRYHDNVHLIGESRVVCGITHYDERCKLACATLNLAIAHLLLVGPEGLVEELLDFAEPRNTVIGYSLRAIPGLAPRELRSSGLVTDTLQAALWTSIYVESFDEGLTLLGLRPDSIGTLGTVAAALLGARFGAENIPERWQAQIRQRERVERGSRQLYDLAMEG